MVWFIPKGGVATGWRGCGDVAWCGGILSRHLTDAEWPKIDSLKAPEQIANNKKKKYIKKIVNEVARKNG